VKKFYERSGKLIEYFYNERNGCSNTYREGVFMREIESAKIAKL